MYIETVTSSPYFLTAGKLRISSKQLSQVSPAVIRRSSETVQPSATAHRLGEEWKICETVTVPRPKKRASCHSGLYLGSNIRTKLRIAVLSVSPLLFKARTSCKISAIL